MNDFSLSKSTVVLRVYFYYLIFIKAMGLTKITPNIDSKQPGDGTSYSEESEMYSSDGFSLLWEHTAGWGCVIGWLNSGIV